MKHVYRAYPATTKWVQGLASLAVGGSVLARGISHSPQVNAALLGIGLVAVTVQVVRFLPSRVTIGDDGLSVRWLWSRRFVRRAAIASIEQPYKTRLRIHQKDGSVCEFNLTSEKSVTPLRADLARLGERAAADRARPRHSAAFGALAARVTAWARASDGAEEAAPASVAYRSGDSPEQLWEIAADVDAPALVRVGAVHALGPLDDDARARVRELAESSADPLAAGAFDAAAAGDRKRMRAIVSGDVAGDAPLATAADETQGVMPALLHPNRAVLGLAWLSRLWFIAPLVGLMTNSSMLTTASFLACAVGAMPWAAAREMDPLVRVVPGRVDIEDGFIMQGGERMLELATVTAAFVHYREGAPPVVRLEGKLGWPLLDVRVETLDEARALLRRLPLREDQREARFGTMHPGAVRFIALAAAAAAVLTVIALTHLTHPYALAALGALGLSTARVRRLITVKRDGLLLRSPWKTRFIRFDDVATVERRKGAGIVVLQSGERVMLRSIAGEETEIVDDDLTETVIDRLEEMRAAKVIRARVAEEAAEEQRGFAPATVTEDGAHEERDENADEEAPGEAKQRARPRIDDR